MRWSMSLQPPRESDPLPSSVWQTSPPSGMGRWAQVSLSTALGEASVGQAVSFALSPRRIKQRVARSGFGTNRVGPQFSGRWHVFA